jgi:transcriptional regulator with XRE-family HTH domain
MANRKQQGKVISSAIRAAEISQGEFARRLGVSASYVSRVVNGRRTFGAKYIRAISELIQVPVEELLP